METGEDVRQADLLLTNARVVDGTGAPWFLGTVAVAGERVVEVGPDLSVDAAVTVDLEGRFLAPGFIDTHTHDDVEFLRNPARPEKLAQGVTTVVTGNCGFSTFPSTPGHVGDLVDHVSSLMGSVADTEVFADVRGYQRKAEAAGMGPNLVPLMGHGALRLAVMGYADRPATATEIDAMLALVDAQFEQGLTGLSLGLVYPPSSYATRDELVALGQLVAARRGVLAAHIRSYEGGLIAAVREFLEILEASGAVGLLSHLQAAGEPHWGAVAKALSLLETSREAGIDVSFDMYPYLAGSSTILQLLPGWAQEGGRSALLERLSDDATRQRIAAWIAGETGAGETAESKVALIGWKNIAISSVASDALARLQGLDMETAALREGVSPFELMVRLIEEDGGRTTIILHQLDEDDLRQALGHRLYMLGSDSIPRPTGKPHPRGYGSFPRYLARYVFGERRLAIEEAVRHMTGQPAQRFHLWDRGLIRPGMVADLVAFGPHASDLATFDEPTKYPSGIHRVWVRGAEAMRDGSLTLRREGRVLLSR